MDTQKAVALVEKIAGMTTLSEASEDLAFGDAVDDAADTLQVLIREAKALRQETGPDINAPLIHQLRSLYAEINVLGAPDSAITDDYSRGYNAALDRVLGILSNAGFEEGKSTAASEIEFLNSNLTKGNGQTAVTKHMETKMAGEDKLGGYPVKDLKYIDDAEDRPEERKNPTRIKIRSRRESVFEAEVDVQSGPREEMIKAAVTIADERDLWKLVIEKDGDVQIVSEEGRVPTIRKGQG